MKTMPSRKGDWVTWKDTQPSAAVRAQVPMRESVWPE